MSNDDAPEFACPLCAGRVYRSSRRGRQVYKCNDLDREADCPVGHEAVGRTKPQVRRAYAEFQADGDRDG